MNRFKNFIENLANLKDEVESVEYACHDLYDYIDSLESDLDILYDALKSTNKVEFKEAVKELTKEE